MSATMPMKAQPRRNPLLTMARYMSDAGADGYAGLTLLYHQTTTQLIIQWTGVDISQPEKIEAEQNLLKLLKGCEVIDANEDVEPLDFDDPEPGLEMNDDNAVSEMESINFTEPASPEFEVKKEPEEMSQSQCNKSVSSGEGDASFGSFTVNPLEFSGSSLTTSNSPVNSTSHTTPNPIVFPGMERLPKRPVTTVGQTSSTSTYPTTAHTGTSSAAATSVSIKGISELPQELKLPFSHPVQAFRGITKRPDVPKGNTTAMFLPVQPPIMATQSTTSSEQPTKANGSWYFQCRRCDFNSYTKTELDRHKHWAHAGSKPYRCSLCSFSCSYSHVLKRHLLTHTGEKPHQCKLCHKRFARSDSVVKHMETHSPRRSRPVDTSRTPKDERNSPHTAYLPADSRLYAGGTPQRLSSPANLIRQSSGFHLPTDQNVPGLNVVSEFTPAPHASKVNQGQRCPSPPPLKDNRPVFPQRRDSFEQEAPPDGNDSSQ